MKKKNHSRLGESFIPISLYIHIPWCVKKCPYCDFNSYAIRDPIPEAEYVTRLLCDFQQQLPLLQGRKLHSIFIGGGTPSAFSADRINCLLSGIDDCLKQLDYAFSIFEKNSREALIEITLEANPGLSDQSRFQGYRQAGVNRLSLGIQSFNHEYLQRLGRVHDHVQAEQAIHDAHAAGFKRINLDLMFALPQQTLAAALTDLKTAISHQPSHISWYQLTIEPNTFFYKQRPKLPTDDIAWHIQQQGQALLKQAGYEQYEISAYAKPHQASQHNLNYWLFGDYLGIGAGAHSKVTDLQTGDIIRAQGWRNPKDYLDQTREPIAERQLVPTQQRAFEFMLNALRLQQPIPISLFQQRTRLKLENIAFALTQAEALQLMSIQEQAFVVSPTGRRYLNDLLEFFL